MLTDPGDIAKVRGGLEKMQDAEDKFCDVLKNLGLGTEDRFHLQDAVNMIGAASIKASETIPEEPE